MNIKIAKYRTSIGTRLPEAAIGSEDMIIKVDQEYVKSVFGLFVQDELNGTPLPGIYAVYGASGSGKTSFMRSLRNKLAAAKFATADISGSDYDVSVINGGEPESAGLINFEAFADALQRLNKFSLVDSMRDLILIGESGWATLSGGVPASYLFKIGMWNQVARTKGAYSFVNFNPLLADSDGLRSSITAMCAGFINLDDKTIFMREFESVLASEGSQAEGTQAIRTFRQTCSIDSENNNLIMEKL